MAHDTELPWAQVARECQRILKRLVDPATVNRWKTGKQEPTLAEFEALAEVLATQPAKLAFDDHLPEVRQERETPPRVLQHSTRKRRKG